jgi:CheY-like chemotaxis protein
VVSPVRVRVSPSQERLLIGCFGAKLWSRTPVGSAPQVRAKSQTKSQDADADKATGFEVGADDYLTKPFELQELVLRARALDRRRARHRPPVRELAGLRVDPFRRLPPRLRPVAIRVTAPSAAQSRSRAAASRFFSSPRSDCEWSSRIHWVPVIVRVPDRHAKVRKLLQSLDDGCPHPNRRTCRDFAVLEGSARSLGNRGVPGSSAGLAIRRSACLVDPPVVPGPLGLTEQELLHLSG